jgi:hypothetical protein
MVPCLICNKKISGGLHRIRMRCRPQCGIRSAPAADTHGFDAKKE